MIGPLFQRPCPHLRDAMLAQVYATAFPSVCLCVTCCFVSKRCEIRPVAIEVEYETVLEVVHSKFKVYDADSIEFIRQQCDLPYIGTLIERRRLMFVDKLLDIPHLAGLLCIDL